VALGLALRGIASAALDLSDGLIGDLGHILAASACGARIDTVMAATLLDAHDLPLNAHERLALVLGGGDDYELLFTAAPDARAHVQSAGRHAGVPLTCIGTIEAAPGLRLLDAQGRVLPNPYASFDHFR